MSLLLCKIYLQNDYDLFIFFIEDHQLHILDLVKDNKSYHILIGNQIFSYSRIQLALLAPKALKHYSRSSDPFKIEIHTSFGDINLEKFCSCFRKLDLLFHTKDQIILTKENLHLMKYIAKSLDNRFLLIKFQKVTSSKPQKFHLSSKFLTHISSNQLSS
jgi:hypothetical protein